MKNTKNTIETTEGPMRIVEMSSWAAAEAAIDICKGLGRNDPWPQTNVMWTWPNDPRFRREK